MNRLSMLALAGATLVPLAACNDTSTTADTTDMAMPAEESMPVGTPVDAPADMSGTIVGVAQGAPTFSTLVTAVTGADLAGTLNGTGPYTVFAPTNTAFEKIPQATRDTLMAPAGKDDLAGILRNHVVSGRLTAADLTRQIEEGNGAATLTTVGGGKLTARLDGTTVVITDAQGGRSRVTAVDTAASNGVIHTIDTVLMPA